MKQMYGFPTDLIATIHRFVAYAGVTRLVKERTGQAIISPGCGYLLSDFAMYDSGGDQCAQDGVDRGGFGATGPFYSICWSRCRFTGHPADKSNRGSRCICWYAFCCDLGDDFLI